MQAIQLGLKLWDDLGRASAMPEAADLDHLWAELKQINAGLANEPKLKTAGKAIEQIAEVLGLPIKKLNPV